MSYKVYKTMFNQDAAIKFNEDGTTVSFLFDPDNTDYQAYLKWVDDGNTPLPAEEQA